LGNYYNKDGEVESGLTVSINIDSEDCYDAVVIPDIKNRVNLELVESKPIKRI